MTMQNTTKQSLARRFEDYQPTKSMLAWACVATAVATMIIGFGWGGWVTGGTSRSLAMTAGDASRSRTGVGHLRRTVQGHTRFGRQARRVQGHHGQLQEAAIRRDRRLGDHAGAEVSGSACRGRLCCRTRSVTS